MKKKHLPKDVVKGFSPSFTAKLLKGLKSMSKEQLFITRKFTSLQENGKIVWYHKLSPKARPFVIYLCEQVKYDHDTEEDDTWSDKQFKELIEVAENFLSYFDSKEK